MINEQELLFVVDQNNNPLLPKSRKETHEKGYWHRTTHIWILNNNHQILCQKRSLKKDTNPGKWEPFFGGHVLAHQEYLESAIQELNEELALTISDQNLTFIRIHKSEKHKEFQYIYYSNWNGNEKTINFEKDEIDSLQWIELKEVFRILLMKEYHWSIPGYTKEIFPLLNEK